MAVYVDQSRYKFKSSYRTMVMCHMCADTLDELHAMADAIGMQRSWFQNGRLPHYDICKSKRALAIKRGAIEVTSKELLRFSQILPNNH